MPLYGLEPVSLAYGINHYGVDKPYQLLLKVFSREVEDFRKLGEFVGREVYELAYRVDRLSQPALFTWGVGGRRADVVWLDPFERMVLERLVRDYGVNKYPFEGRPWHLHYTGIYLVGDPGISCILTITIQTGYALYKYGEGGVREWYLRLAGLSEPLMWGATWFTEVQGGSDLGANATRAEPAGGNRYKLYGYKYFASGAGIADVALVTARLPGSRSGAKGLSLFVVPRLRGDGRLNYHVRRLKWKSGTVAVPTGEVELDGSEAYLLGEPDRGIYYAMEDLMVSRLANSVGALGIARKAYLEAYGYTVVRRAFGKRLIEHPLALRDLVEAEAELEAMAALTLYAVTLFDRAWYSRPPYNEVYHHARLMTHIAKNLTAEAASRITATSMELLGGIGFLHEFPVERWHREALITPIWEGTSNIQAIDMLEAMYKKQAHKPFMEAIEELASNAEDRKLAEEALHHAEKALKRVARDPGNAEFYAKEILRALGYAAATLLLLEASRVTGDEGFHTAAKVFWQLRVKGTLDPLPRHEAEELVSLRGGLDEVDWEAKALRAAPGV
ncbi:MAG: acyl-CoA dehydrogenase family protein [Thermoproteota archaeon]